MLLGSKQEYQNKKSCKAVLSLDYILSKDKGSSKKQP